MASLSNWEEKVAIKRTTQLKCIPGKWCLPESYLKEAKSASGGVLKVPEECGLLSTEELRITGDYDVVRLSGELQSGKLSSKEVTTAFCKRAAIAHQLVGYDTLKSRSL